MVLKGNRILIRLAAIISCFIALFFFAACNKNNGQPEEDKKPSQVIEEENHIKAVFERHNNIYLYDEKYEQLQPIGETTKFKELMALSPDKKNIAFKYFYEESSNSIEVIIYNLEGKSYKTITIEDLEMQNIVELKWINEKDILISSAINPSVLKYEIYDISAMEQLSSVKGLLMKVMKDKTYLYSKGDKEVNNNNLYLGEKLIYKLKNKEEEIHFADISEDEKKIAFRTISYGKNGGEIKEYLYITELNLDSLPLKTPEKLEIPPNVLGEVFFDKEGSLYIKGEEYVYKLEGTEFKLIGEAKKDSTQPTEEQLTKFKKFLKDNFDNEFIQDYLELEEMEIYNIQWF